MNIISSNHSKNVVSLEELVPQHDCLKLLILHTPYTLVIDTLHLCINLVKLDLSKNNLEGFPYLGELSNLKFMFIHENKLNVNDLKGIFQKNNKKSVLSNSIVWATFWGNKNSFLGRHYLVNETSAIAVDKNMVVQQQRTNEVSGFICQPFSLETDISEFFLKKTTINRHASEEEYMRELWIEMNQLRKINEKLFPVIKIQKVYRGWIVRQKHHRLQSKLEEGKGLISSYFKGWKLYVHRNMKLKLHLQRKKKEFLLLEKRERGKKEYEYRMIEIAKEVKRKMDLRKMSLSNQMRVYSLFKKNCRFLQNMYRTLEVQGSSAVYICANSWEIFAKNVVPFVKRFHREVILPMQNKKFSLHYLHEYYSENTKEFIKILQTNVKSTLFQYSKSKITSKNNNRRPLMMNSSLKNIYGAIHITTAKRLEIQQHIDNLVTRRKYQMEELIKIEGGSRLLKDIVRGVFFYNTGVFNYMKPVKQRINIFTEKMLKRIACAVKIQKVWRGYYFRKKNDIHVKLLMKLQRAAVIIQRWVRKIPCIQKNYFMYNATRKLNQAQNGTFYVEVNDYFQEMQSQKNEQSKAFHEQNVKLYFNKSTNSIVINWNTSTQNIAVIQNIRNNRPLFGKSFLCKKIGFSNEEVPLKFPSDTDKLSPCQFSFLFHYDSDSSLVVKQGKKYLEVKCKNKIESKFRMFCLMLLTYRIRNRDGLKIINENYFNNSDIKNKIGIGRENVNFICNQNFDLIKFCQLKFKNDSSISLHIISNRFYIQNKEEKPIKAEEKFFIYTGTEVKKAVEPQVKISKNINDQRKRYKTEVSEIGGFQAKNFITQLLVDAQSNASEQIRPSKLKLLIRKRSVKQFKVQKRAKKQQQPSFILDSVSINDRLTTQPDINAANISNRENNPKTQNSQLNHIEVNLLKNRVKQAYAERRGNSNKRKEHENFTKRFVNLANFIQSQYANDERRRIKTEIQNGAADTTENIKRSLERSISQRNQEVQQKQKRIRDKHSLHRQVIQKSHILTRERSLQLKSQVKVEKERKTKEKAQLKRLKVSFAEECFPLATKSKIGEYLS